MTAEDEMSYIEVKNVCKTYGEGENVIHALRGVSFGMEKGEICVIVGQSGAGKTTLLNILGGMDTLTSGEIFVDGRAIHDLKEKELAGFRRRDIGFVFQFYNLIPNLTALENVEIASQLGKDPLDSRKVMEQVGLKGRMDNFPAQLSGGEQQRVAIARALAKRPKLLLCDEPTGALDYETGKQILRLLQDQARYENMTVTIITHNQALTGMADRVIRIRNGSIDSMYMNEDPMSIDDIEW